MAALEVDPAPARPTVLIVEDEVLIRLMVADELRNAGVHVLEASSADEAWTILQSALPVHLLFTDIHMRGEMDGVALAQLVHGRYPQMKLIITSSREPEGSIRPAAAVFVGKPYDLRTVVAQVKALLAEPNAEQR